MLRLANKTAIVTGSTSGIGEAIAIKFAAQGARIIICGRKKEPGLEVVETIKANGGDAAFFQTDIAQETQVQALIDFTIKTHGRIDILVNNAGPNGKAIALGAIDSLPTSLFDESIRIGVYGLFWCCKYTLPHMITAGSGNIINISSLAAVRAIPKFGAYAMSKAAMEALSRQIANDYANHNIRSNSLLVGTVRAAIGENSTLPDTLDFNALDAMISQTTMMGKLGNYADVANAALFLASDESRYITGTSIPVDAGAFGKIQYPDYTSGTPDQNI